MEQKLKSVDSESDITFPKEIMELFDSEARKVAINDTREIFLQMFSKARQIAAEKESNSPSLKIRKTYWQEAKWRTIIEWGLKRKKIVRLFEFFLFISPIVIGYGFSNPKEDWIFIVVGSFIASIAFILKELNEGKK